jgi:hypothetical protein
MQAPRLAKIVKRVTLLQTSASGVGTPVTLFTKENRRKKKATPGLRGVENVLERMTDAQRAFADTFASRSKESRRKKSDGNLRDMGSNVFRAFKAGRKKLRVPGLPV